MAVALVAAGLVYADDDRYCSIVDVPGNDAINGEFICTIDAANV